MGYILAAKWFLFWCNYSQQTFSSSFLRVWVVRFTGCFVERVGSFNMHAYAFYFLHVKKAYHTRWYQYIEKRTSLVQHASWLSWLLCLQIMLKFPTQHSQINRQTSLKQHLPLTTSAHQLKGSQWRSIKIDSLFGRQVSKHTAFSFTTDGTGTNKMENAKRCWAISVLTKLLWCLIRNSGLTTVNQPAAMQKPLTGKAAVTWASEWSSCYITSQAWPQSEQRDSKID